MHRRKGISPTLPSRHSSSSSMSSEKEVSRLNQRSLGVTNRIWLILALFVFLLTFTHFVLPTTHTPTYAFSSLGLTPKNYLNASEVGPNPFDFCPIYGPGDEIGSKHGATPLGKTRLHLGSGVRIQHVLNRALAGQPITISIIGGSISSCHGAGDDPISPKCYPSRFFQWWNSVFPHPASELTNGAMRRTSSEYFAFCSAHHIPDHTDLVIIELDSDDRADQQALEDFEVLVRSILIRPDLPAVLILGHFSPQIHTAYGFAGPDHYHNIVAQFYDVPHISAKALVYPEYMQDPDAVISKYYVDPVLASPRGHELIADALISYLQSQICTAWAVASGAAYDVVPARTTFDQPAGDTHGLFGGVGLRKGVPEDEAGSDDSGKLADLPPTSNLFHPSLRIPRARIATRPNDARPFQELAPFCVSAHDLINPLPVSLFYGSGWHAFHPPGGTGALQSNKAHYWYSTLPTSKMRVPVQVGAGDIGIYYIKEPINTVGEGSAVECWVDDNYAGARTVENAADVPEATAALFYIDHFVSRGSHFVECQLMGEEGQSVPAFKIVGIFSS
ncbi:unnamed protein product [Mycena citricolor]|uniref:Capsular associated protein n=1 Tax=Mycena citricolor TaxID=2018698 RepID=A0AAD2H5Q2_9AGAR|nr:unnamed protein product [Mycena citricolor]